MNNCILIIAHEPLASALRQCAAHVFPDRVQDVLVHDVRADASPQESLSAARSALARFGGQPVLMLTDMLGGTPCNVARQLAEQVPAKVIAGVNMPMLLRAITYQQEPLQELAARALAGGVQGVVEVL